MKTETNCFRQSLCRLLALACLPAWTLAGAQPNGVRYVEPDDATGTSLAAVVGRVPLAHTTQLLPLDHAGELIGKGDASAQTERVLDNLALALQEGRSGLDQLVKINVCVTQPEAVASVQAVFARRFNGPAKPAASFVVSALPRPGALVALDAVAVSSLTTAHKEVKRLHCAVLPGPAGAAHVAVLPAGGAIYVSGQAEPGELAEATRKTLESLRRTLTHLGLYKLHLVQLKAFLRPMADLAVVEKEIAQFFEDETAPPVVFVEWTSSGNPIEIEAIATAVPGRDKPTNPVAYLTPPNMKASPLFSRVTRLNFGKTIYVSGLYAAAGQDAGAQAHEIFGTLGELLKKSGSDFHHLVKATYYVSDSDASNQLNEARPKFYDPLRPPAASKALVKGVGLPGRSLTLDMIAVTSP